MSKPGMPRPWSLQEKEELDGFTGLSDTNRGLTSWLYVLRSLPAGLKSAEALTVGVETTRSFRRLKCACCCCCCFHGHSGTMHELANSCVVSCEDEMSTDIFPSDVLSFFD